MKNQGFHRRLGFAFNGIGIALHREYSVRLQAVAMLLVLLTLVWLHPAPLWWAIIILTIACVMAAELFNTALEHLLDHLHPELHPQIKVVKDCAAGAVLLVSLGALGVAAAFIYATFF